MTGVARRNLLLFQIFQIICDHNDGCRTQRVTHVGCHGEGEGTWCAVQPRASPHQSTPYTQQSSHNCQFISSLNYLESCRRIADNKTKYHSKTSGTWSKIVFFFSFQRLRLPVYIFQFCVVLKGVGWCEEVARYYCLIIPPYEPISPRHNSLPWTNKWSGDSLSIIRAPAITLLQTTDTSIQQRNISGFSVS